MKILLVLILTTAASFARDRGQLFYDYVNDSYYNSCRQPTIIIEVNIPERETDYGF